MTNVQDYETYRLGPRVVGGIYHSWYWREDYRVEDIVWSNKSWTMTVWWINRKKYSTHCTAWNHGKDQIINQPEGN